LAAPQQSGWKAPADAPAGQAINLHTDDCAHALDLNAECRMPQKAADQFSRFASADIQPNQTVARMSPVRPVEIVVQAEEGRLRLLVSKAPAWALNSSLFGKWAGFTSAHAILASLRDS